MFEKRKSIKQVEEGKELCPKFDGNGLIPVVTTDVKTGNLLMHAYMNREALELTITRERLTITVGVENVSGTKVQPVVLYKKLRKL